LDFHPFFPHLLWCAVLLAGLENFYMVGQWAGAMNGISSAALTGRNLIKELCKKDNKKFKTMK
jgi:hypothetical protein